MYWTDSGNPGAANGTIMKWLPGNRFIPSGVVPIANSQGGPFGIAMSPDGAGPFWTNYDTGTVELAGAPQPVAQGVAHPRDIVVDGAYNSGSGVVYFTDFATPGTVWYVKNNQRCALSTGETVAQGLAVDGTYVYWTNFVGSGVVRRARKL